MVLTGYHPYNSIGSLSSKARVATMRLLHTSDLHLGRQFNGISLEEDHAAILDQVVQAILDHQVDVLLIAGDIFDRPAPPAFAVRQFNAFVERIRHQTRAALVMIAGNHDSADRISAMATMPDPHRVLIRGTVAAEEPPLIVHDADGPVAFSALPFSYEYAARDCFDREDLQCPQDVLAAQIAAARPHIPAGARWVVVAHAFVTGATPSDSERSLVRVGGTEMVSTDVFEGAHYVALGHIHRPQTVGAAHMRYSGSPLAFGFDEADSTKSMALVDLQADGTSVVHPLPFTPLRGVRVLTGRHADLLASPPSDDFIKVILTDTTPVIDGMKRLRTVFPNTCDLTYQHLERQGGLKPFQPQALPVHDPLSVINDFLTTVREDPLSEAERKVIETTLDELETEEAAR